MYEVRLKDLVSFYDNAEKILQKPFSFITAYSLSKIREAAEKEAPFYKDKLSELILECAQTNPDGTIAHNEKGNILLKEDKIKYCNEKLIELGEIEVQIGCKKINPEELKNISWTAEEISILSPFIEI